MTKANKLTYDHGEVIMLGKIFHHLGDGIGQRGHRNRCLGHSLAGEEWLATGRSRRELPHLNSFRDRITDTTDDNGGTSTVFQKTSQ